MKTRGDWVIRGLFYFYVKCRLRGKTDTVWDKKDIEDSVKLFMKGGGGMLHALKCSFIYYLLLEEDTDQRNL